MMDHELWMWKKSSFWKFALNLCIMKMDSYKYMHKNRNLFQLSWDIPLQKKEKCILLLKG